MLTFCNFKVLLIFMQKMELLLKKTPNEDVKNHVLPMVFRALESQSSQIQVHSSKLNNLI